jgi:hypothetical protein
MRQVKNEEVIIAVKAHRKGRSKKTCEIGVCVTDESEIILRTEDVGGVSPIVIVLNSKDAVLLEMGLAEALKMINNISNPGLKIFDRELEELEKWAEDTKSGLETEIINIDKEIILKRSKARKLTDVQERVKNQREIEIMEKTRKHLRQKLFEVQNDVETRKEEMIKEAEDKMNE